MFKVVCSYVRFKMRWQLAFVFFSFICSVISESDGQPKLEIKASVSVYNVGEKKGIYCEKFYIPESIEWIGPNGQPVPGRSTKNTRIYVEQPRSEPNVSTLIIQSTKLNDTGNWTCKAGDFSETLEIVVGEKVVFPENPVDVNADEGTSAKLNCEAKGSPDPDVQWYKENSFIKEDPKYLIKKNGNTHTLIIKGVNYKDKGEYVCKVRQKALSHYTQRIFNLIVHHKPLPFDPETNEYIDAKFRIEEVYAVFNESKSITCGAFAYPLPTFEWFRRKNSFDSPIRDEELIETSEDGMSSTLTLNLRDMDDMGLYRCAASNKKGKIVVDFDVTPAEKPAPPDYIKFVDSNATYIQFNVTCSTNSCRFAVEGEDIIDPKNLPIIKYWFELTPHSEETIADWSVASKFTVDIEDPEYTIFDVGPLANNTKYHVRVRSLNKAGASDWLELEDEELPTTKHAIKAVASLLLVAAAIVLAM